jgi:membrane protein DedA with SNARE-associated domain
MNQTNENHGPGHADPQVPLMAALAALLALSLFMAVAAFTGIVPSPPHDKLPFVAANIALAVAALVVVRGRHRAAPWMSLLAGLSYLPSVGPHKLLTEVHAAALTPVIAVGSACVLVIAWSAWRLWRSRRARWV